MTTHTVAADARYRKAIELAANAQQIVAIPGERAYPRPGDPGRLLPRGRRRLPLS